MREKGLEKLTVQDQYKLKRLKQKLRRKGKMLTGKAASCWRRLLQMSMPQKKIQAIFGEEGED